MSKATVIRTPMKKGQRFILQGTEYQCDSCKVVPASQSVSGWPEWHIKGSRLKGKR